MILLALGLGVVLGVGFMAVLDGLIWRGYPSQSGNVST